MEFVMEVEFKITLQKNNFKLREDSVWLGFISIHKHKHQN